MARKTLAVSTFVDTINARIAKSSSPSDCKLMCSILEEVLFDADKYAGYQYLEWENGGYEAWKTAKAETGQDLDNTPYRGPDWKRRYYHAR